MKKIARERNFFQIHDISVTIISSLLSEFFYNTDEDVEAQLSMSLQAVVSGKKRFVSQYKETEAEDKLMQEINKQE